MAAQAVIELLLKDKRFQQALGDAQRDASKLKRTLNDGGDPFASFNKGMSSVRSNLASAVKAAGAFAAAAGGIAIAIGFKKAIEGAMEAERAVNDAAQAMARTGEYSRAAMSDVQAFAAQLLATKGVGDDTALGMFSLAKSFGLTNDQAKLAVSSAADLSAATGRDLRTAVEQVSGSFNGKIGALAKLNPALKDLTKTELEAGRAAAILGQQFEGAAAARLNTFEGALGVTTEKLGNMLEELGRIVVENPVVVKLVQELGDSFDRLGQYVADNKDELVGFVNDGIITMVRQLSAAVKAWSIFARALEQANPFDTIDRDIKTVNDSIYDQMSYLQKASHGWVLLMIGIKTFRRELATTDRAIAGKLGLGLFSTPMSDEELKKLDESIEKLKDLRYEIEMAPGQNDPFAQVRKNFDKTKDSADDLSSAIADIATELERTNGKKASVFIEPKNAGGAGGGSTASPYDWFAGPDQSTGAVSDALREDAKKKQDKLAAMGGAIAAGIVGGLNTGGLAGAIQAISSTVQTGLQAITDKMGPWIQAIVAAIEFGMQDPVDHDAKVTSFMEGLPQALENLNTNMETMPDLLVASMDKIGFQLAKGFPDFIVNLVRFLPKILSGIIKELPGAIAMGFKEGLNEAVRDIEGGFGYYVDKIGGFFAKMQLDINGFQEGAHNAGTRFSDAVKAIGAKFKATMDIEVARLKDALRKVGSALEGAGQKAGNWLSAKAATAAEWLQQAGGKIAAAWQALIQQFRDAGAAVQAAVDRINDWFTKELPEKLKDAGGKLAEGFKDLFASLGDLGTKFYNSVVEAGQAFIDKVSGSKKGNGNNIPDAIEYHGGGVLGQVEGGFSLTGGGRSAANVVPISSSALSAGSANPGRRTRSAATSTPSTSASDEVTALLSRLVQLSETRSEIIEVKIDSNVLAKAIRNLNFRNARLAG